MLVHSLFNNLIGFQQKEQVSKMKRISFMVRAKDWQTLKRKAVNIRLFIDDDFNFYKLQALSIREDANDAQVLSNVVLSDEQIERLDKWADELDLNRSQLLRRIIIAILGREDI